MNELKISLKWGSGALALLFAGASALMGQAGQFPNDRPPQPGALGTVVVPMPANLGDFVVNRKAAIVLGKALFWDSMAGSDGLACASCHFQAGADSRFKNQMDPGLRNTNPAMQNIWHLTASNKNNRVGPPPGGGPNYSLNTADFPFHQLLDPNDRNSTVLFDSNDVVSSQGVFRGDFNHINVVPKGAKGVKQANKKLEVCNAAINPTFAVAGVNVRQVEPRNTPTVINSIFNFRNFWDGRANNIFNGRNPFGPRDPTAGIDPLNSVLVADAYGRLSPMIVSIPDASLASQAVGPPGSDLEMSCRGRVFEEIGQKMLTPSLWPLSKQDVDPTDSVLGSYVFPGKKKGLNISYETLIKQAFASKFWSGMHSADGYRQIEKNFSLFWGLSIMLYESTLVSDNAPFDQYMNGNIQALTAQQAHGFQVFIGSAGCIFCHKGAEFTGAATSQSIAKAQGAQMEHMLMGDGTVALYDTGWYNIGVRPTSEDIGVGGTDPWGNPLSWSRQTKNVVAAGLSAVNLLNVGPDGFNVLTCNFQVDACFPVTSDARDAIDGNFKVPTLRNVELTGPYFHNGGQSTLEQVVDFYDRGGDGAGTDFVNSTGFGINPTNRAPAIFPLNLNDADKAALVAFLKSLTDERVRWEKAPFDHPALMIPNGHRTNEKTVKAVPGTVYADDDWTPLPAVGAAGRAALNLRALFSFGDTLPFKAK